MQFRLLAPYVLLVATALAATGVEKGNGILRLYEMSDLLFPNEYQQDLSAGRDDAEMRWPKKDWGDLPREAFNQHLASHFQPAVLEHIRASSRWRGRIWGLVASPEFHNHVEQVLTQARNTRVLEIQLNCSLVLMPPQARAIHFARSEFNWKPVAERPDVRRAEVSREEAEKFMSAAAKDPRVTKATIDLSLGLAPGMLAATPSTKYYEYLPLIPLPSLEKTQPKIIPLGHRLVATATPTEDRSLLTICLDHQCAELIDKRTVDTGHGTAEEPIVWKGGEHVECLLAVNKSLIIATGIYLDSQDPPQCGFLVVSPWMITHRGFTSPDPTTVSGTPTDVAESPMSVMLNKSVSVDFVNSSLVDAIENLRQQTAAPLTVDPALAASSPAISFQCKKISLGAALDWIINLSDLVLEIDQEHIRLLPLDSAQAHSKPQQVISPERSSEAVHRQLEFPISMKWENTDISETLIRLRTQTAIPIIVDPKLIGENHHHVTLWVEKMKLKFALDHLCKQLGVQYKIQDGAIHLYDGQAPANGQAQ